MNKEPLVSHSGLDSENQEPDALLTGEPRKPPNPPEDLISGLLGAGSFNIAEHRVEDLQVEAAKHQRSSLVFDIGKPPGLTQGVALATNGQQQLKARVVVRRLGRAVKFALPTPEFVEAELAGFLETVHFIPAVNLTRSLPTAHLMPYRVSAWADYAEIFEMLSKLNHTREGVYLRYTPGVEGQVGRYSIEKFILEEEQKKLLEHVRWPLAEELRHLLPTVPFEQLAQEDFNLKRAWAAAQLRKSGGR